MVLFCICIGGNASYFSYLRSLHIYANIPLLTTPLLLFLCATPDFRTLQGNVVSLLAITLPMIVGMSKLTFRTLYLHRICFSLSYVAERFSLYIAASSPADYCLIKHGNFHASINRAIAHSNTIPDLDLALSRSQRKLTTRPTVCSLVLFSKVLVSFPPDDERCLLQ